VHHQLHGTAAAAAVLAKGNDSNRTGRHQTQRIEQSHVRPVGLPAISDHVEQLRRQELRLNASLDPFHRAVLDLDPVREMKVRDDDSLALRMKNLAKIPLRFQSSEEYRTVFEPLLIEEARAMLVTALDEIDSRLTASTRYQADSEPPFVPTTVAKIKKVDDFHLVHFNCTDTDTSATRVSEDDMVLVWIPTRRDSEHKYARSDAGGFVSKDRMIACSFARVNPDSSTSNSRHPTYLKSQAHFEAKLLLRGASSDNPGLASLLKVGLRCRVTILTNFKTLHREFRALQAVDTLPMVRYLLNPSFITRAKPASVIPSDAPLSRTFESALKLNESQAAAVRACLQKDHDTNPFSLIHGPPGTGKTRTIIALLNALLVQKPPGRVAPQMKPAADLSDGTVVRTELRHGPSFSSFLLARPAHTAVASTSSAPDDPSSIHPQVRILVCAPSNAAVDEILRRLELHQMVDQHGNVTKLPPQSIVRVGAGSKGTDIALVFIQNLFSVTFGICARHVSFPDFNIYDPHRGDSSLHKREISKAPLSSAGHDAGRSSPPSGAMVHDDQAGGGPGLLAANTILVDLEEAANATLGDHCETARRRDALNARNGGPTTSAAAAAVPGQSDLEQLLSLRAASRKKLKDIRQELDAASAADPNPAPHQAVPRLIAQKRQLQSDLDRLGNRIEAARAAQTASRDMARLEVLSKASIVCTTLSGSGMDVFPKLFRRGHAFDFVVIDEAAQAVEISALIPLRYGCKSVVLVGDPQQLSATVISSLTVRFDYQQSLFSRLLHAGAGVNLLDLQYRMHPEISRFPSRFFYDAKVKDALAEKYFTKPYHSDARLGPCMFYDVQSSERSAGRGSFDNQAEAQMVVALCYFMYRHRNGLPAQSIPKHGSESGKQFVASIGIITPYSAQKRTLVAAFRASYQKLQNELEPGELSSIDSSIARMFFEWIRRRVDACYSWHSTDELLESATAFLSVEIDTVDGFQGREKDIVIFSCVRANRQRAIGFLSHPQRLNVAITRPRFGLYLVGNSQTLESDVSWRFVVHLPKPRDPY